MLAVNGYVLLPMPTSKLASIEDLKAQSVILYRKQFYRVDKEKEYTTTIRHSSWHLTIYWLKCYNNIIIKISWGKPHKKHGSLTLNPGNLALINLFSCVLKVNFSLGNGNKFSHPTKLDIPKFNASDPINLLFKAKSGFWL